MRVLECWYNLDTRFVAPAELLNETFATRIADHDATVYPPSVTVGDGVGRFGLAPPRILGRPPAESGSQWGIVHQWTKAGPVGVVVEQLAFTAEIADGEDLQHAAESIVAAMDTWWDNVRSWLEVVTGQHLTRVGHQKTLHIGNPPIWPLLGDGTHERPISVAATISLQVGGPQVAGVTADILRDCVALADEGPSLAWILLRDARSLAEADQRRRAVIDASTAAELAVTAMLDVSLRSETPSEAARLRNSAKTLGRKADLLGRRGHPLPDSFFPNLVDRRNDAVHEGVPISPGDCRAAIAEAVPVVEIAFPLPTPPGTGQAIRRLW